MPNPKTIGKLICEGNTSDQWEDATDAINQVMFDAKKIFWWKAEVKNFGWQKLNGEKEFPAKNGMDMLRAILPDTECTFKVYRFGKGYAVNNAHHDSPTWDEWYYIVPARKRIDK